MSGLALMRLGNLLYFAVVVLASWATTRRYRVVLGA